MREVKTRASKKGWRKKRAYFRAQCYPHNFKHVTTGGTIESLEIRGNVREKTLCIVPPSLPLATEQLEINEKNKTEALNQMTSSLQTLCHVNHKLSIVCGSILEFEGDAFVNAANEGCT